MGLIERPIEKCEFDAEAHKYCLDGKQLPSVTQVLPDIPDWLLCKQEFIDKTLLGTRVHTACEQINKGRKLTKQMRRALQLQPQDEPYIQAWERYLKESGITIIESELRVFSKRYGYAGTLDVICQDPNKQMVLLDIKTVTLLKQAVRLQLAGYIIAYNEMNYPKQITRRRAVQLKPDGTYRKKDIPTSTLDYDKNIFLCKVQSARWDIENAEKML